MGSNSKQCAMLQGSIGHAIPVFTLLLSAIIHGFSLHCHGLTSIGDSNVDSDANLRTGVALGTYIPTTRPDSQK